MSHLSILPTRLAPVVSAEMRLKPAEGWATLPDAAREGAELARLLIEPVLQEVAAGVSRRRAVALIKARIDAGRMPASYAAALATYGGDISEATLDRLTRKFLSAGLLALAPAYKGRVRKTYGWETRAMALYLVPNRPAFATVAYWLRGEGFDTASNHLVRRYLQSLPSHLCETSPKRLGQHYYNQNVKPYHRRDVTVLQVGERYESDGHCCDVYVAHPATGSHYRPELTTLIDVRSRYLVAFWLGEHESSIQTLYTLARGIRLHGHVPAMLHTDPGSGFKNKLLGDKVHGYYERLSITHEMALPGNARGKGLQEGWFRWFEERLGKQFETFCGHCRTDDALTRLRQRIAKGELHLPSFQEYFEAVAAYIDRYNNTPQDALGGQTPAQLWATLQPTPPHLDEALLLRPQTERTVRHWEVRVFNRIYRAAALQGYEARKVRVEYDIHDARSVLVRDDKGRAICEAQLVSTTAAVQANVLEDRRHKSLSGAQARLQARADELEARTHTPLTPAELLDALDAPTVAAPPQAGPHSALDASAWQTPPVPAPAAPRPVSAIALAAVRQQIAAEQQAPAVPDSPRERYALWQRLSAEGQQTEWMTSYQRTSEWRAHQLISRDRDLNG